METKINIKKGINLVLKDIKYWSKAPVWTPKGIKAATQDWFKYLNSKINYIKI